MAAATKNEEVVEVVKSESYTLELTPEEAQYLHKLVGASPGCKPSYAIYDALHEALR